MKDAATLARRPADGPALRDDVRALAADLRRAIAGEARFDAGSRALYATDGSNYRQVPIGVVVPRTIDDVIATVETCRGHGVPILSRGGGTSLAGQCCNVAVVIDWSKHLNRIIEVDPEASVARVQPGVILDSLRREAERHHLTFAPDPSTHDHCTLGGMIGNNSCGVHSQMGGRTSENVIALDVLTYDGVRFVAEEGSVRGGPVAAFGTRLDELQARYADLIRLRYPKIPRRISGYNLDDLLPENGPNLARALTGTESTCVTMLEATVRLVPSPPVRSLLVMGYPDVFAAADAVPEILGSCEPLALEGIDAKLVEDIRKKKAHPEDLELLPDGEGWLLVEFGGQTKEEADARARRLMKKLNGAGAPTMKLCDDPRHEKRIWHIRESGLGATARIPGEPDTWEGWEDSAVPPERLGEYLRDLRALYDQHGYDGALYGHFGQGCIHTRVTFDLVSREGIERFRSFLDDASDVVLGYGGSFSGEHGDGQSRAELLPKMFGPELIEAFREFKSIWDPAGKMNPGKIVDPDPITSNLRLGTNYRPARPKTHFAFPDDDGSLARASLRCVGVGLCRREEGGTMCPSYMATREEMHSTRGRAHLLHEMLVGDVLDRGWRNEHVKEALDLCLACKGCKAECPVNVDVATYKAEFLSHHYAGRLRPRPAYALGLIHRWARLASHLPRFANVLAGWGPSARALKAIGGLAPEREIPRFAERTFKAWHASRPASNEARPPVILWPDTFTNHFAPDIAIAATEVLEDAGYRVLIPRETLCCGRPLYDYGMLPTAKRLLRQTLDTLAPHIRAGTPLIGLEPSCLATFRDELVNLFPDDEDARRLSQQSFLLAEFLVDEANYRPQKLERTVLVHGHCHHKAIVGLRADEEMLTRLGVNFTVPDSGCCGMAGSFGFERDKYELSMKIGERVLLPAVRNTDADTLLLTDGFSCREQIRHGTGHDSVHLAQLLRLAIRGIEQRGTHSTHQNDLRPPRRVVRLSAAAAAVGVLALRHLRRNTPAR